MFIAQSRTQDLQVVEQEHQRNCTMSRANNTGHKLLALQSRQQSETNARITEESRCQKSVTKRIELYTKVNQDKYNRVLS